MSQLLTAAALVALSVADLVEELKKEYPIGVLNEALGMEAGKTDKRKTAIEALTDAAEEAAAKAEEEAAAKAEEEAAAKAEEEAAAKAEEEAAAGGHVIAKGKSLTSLIGILSEGAPVSPENFAGGQATFDRLKDRGFIE
jgi:FKBP-type peptidyl-prolyl cis-trans isomerase